MKKNILLIIASVCMVLVLQAQETVVWGSKVVDVSSEYSALEYSAIQALHKPNVLPSGGGNPNAWRPKKDDKEDFIMVSFDQPMKARQIAVAESENPGAVKQIVAYDEDYNEYVLFELTPRSIPLESRLLNLFFDEPAYKIAAIKVVIDGETVPGYNSIDAIGISQSNIPISVLIDLAANVNNDLQTERLSSNVNSSYVEHSPLISPDGKRLYFSRKYHPENVGGINDGEDIWVSELDETTGEWQPAVNLGPPLNTEGPNFISSISIIDGEEVLILGNRYGKRGRMYNGVSMAKRTADGTYTEPTSLEVVNEYNYSPKTDFFLDPTGVALVISAERDDSYGGRDLYVSFKQGDVWSEPKNLGDDINTAGDDVAPFLGTDGKTLYYSTNGISGYGGSDIFVSLRLDDSWTKWSIPENLGSGLNTPSDDQYFSIPSSGTHIYFSRGTIDDDTDIFRFKADELFLTDDSPYLASMEHLIEKKQPSDYLVTLIGQVTSGGTPVPNAKVTLERLPDGAYIADSQTDQDGNYKFIVRGGSRYGISVDQEGFLSERSNFDFNDISASDTISTGLTLTKIEAGAAIVLNNIFFDIDKAVLKTASYSELNKALELLKEGKIKKIEIAGHTDSTGEDAYNQALSERRAKAVYNYFLNNGVSKDRLVAVGYGETQPKVPNDTAANMQLNRRVEFKVLEAL
ncbi:MAG: OmpA family protein [Bacteroidota bacterium]